MNQVISFNIQKCDHCGDEIPEGAYYWANEDKMLCEECYNKNL